MRRGAFVNSTDLHFFLLACKDTFVSAEIRRQTQPHSEADFCVRFSGSRNPSFLKSNTAMANIPNAPGMPVVPSAVDVSRYNLWAARYGQPLWGANHAPGAPAVPAAPAPARRGWQKGKPRGAPAPAPHGSPAGAAAHPDDTWQRGTWEEGKKTFANKKNGQKREWSASGTASPDSTG